MVQSSDDPEALGARFAAFAVGCLGAASPPKAGQKLGLMGSVSLDEVSDVLRQLETLARQRAAKLAGVAFVGTDFKGISPQFQAALGEACGTPGGPELFERLPHDEHGRADVLRVFGMAAGSTGRGTAGRDTISAESEGGIPAFVPSDYIERAADLPHVSEEIRCNAERALIEGDAADAVWEGDARALNVVRAALEFGDCGSLQPSLSDLLSAIARRCTSRRPALAKTALRMLIELAEHESVFSSSWPEAADVAIRAALAALRGTKVVARVAEAALAAVVHRIVAEASPEAAASALAGCTAEAVRAKPPQAIVVSAGLKALAPLVQERAEDIAALCEEVLKARVLGPAYPDARAVLRAMTRPDGE